MGQKRKWLIGTFFKLVVLHAGILMFFPAHAQKFEISGKVVNDQTGESIPFVSIGIKDIHKGTASNALGEFSFRVDSLPVILVFSHLSFETKEITVSESKPIEVRLTPGKLVMDEVVIKAKKGDQDYAYKLLINAHDKIVYRARKEDYYGKAFYRQISKNGDIYSELYEIFFDTRFSRNGVEDWAIQEGRYALRLSEADSFIYNKNFTLMVRLLTIVQPKTDDLIMPVSRVVRDQYYLTLESLLSVDGRTVAVIRFEKKETVKKPAMEGTILIDVDSHDVLKLIGTIKNDHLNFVKLKGNKGYWKNYTIRSEIAFKYLDDRLVMDYMRLWQNFDYYIDSVLIHKVATSSFFSYYEYYNPPKRKKLGGRLVRWNRSDAALLDNLGYNQAFWDNNIIVKRTPVEAEVIASFEAERAFGSIYLNNRDQIMLEDYKLDNDPLIVRVRDQLKKYELPHLAQKVYLHHDKPVYLSGERLWFRAYVVQMTDNIPAQEQDLLHVVLASPAGDIVFASSWPVISGKTFGDISLPDSLPSGEYTLKAYTEWMRNFDKRLFYNERVTILNRDEQQPEMLQAVKNDQNIINFSAEGGNMVESMPVQLGFAVQDRFGKGMMIKGRIFDGAGKQVAPFKTTFDGLGSVFMLPRMSVPYEVVLNNPDVKITDFPRVLPMGYTVLINNLKPNTIDVLVRGSSRLEGKKFYILLVSNGLLIDRRIGSLTKRVFRTEIPKTNLPPGFAQIFIVNEAGQILNKRIIFHNSPEEATVKVYQARKNYDPREKVELVLELRDQNGKPLDNANISVSVLDKDKLSKPLAARNIRSYLYLEQQSDHYLSEPGGLLSDFDRETLKRLDLVALNQKSTLTKITSFDSLQQVEKINISVQRRPSMGGRAIEQKTGKPLPHGFLTIIAGDEFRYLRTGPSGEFTPDPPLAIDAAKAMIVARNSAGQKVPVSVEWERPAGEDAGGTIKTERVPIPKKAAGYLAKKSDVNDPVSARYVKIEKLSTGSEEQESGVKPDFVYRPDTRKRHKYDALKLIGEVVPGLTIAQENGKVQLLVKGSQPAVVVLDGFLLNFHELTGVGEGDDLAVLKKLPADDIKRIEVFHAVPPLYFGIGRQGGLVRVFTQGGYEKWQKIHDLSATSQKISALSPMSLFEGPNYSTKTKHAGPLDRRSTLYWNPDITTNRRGRVKISFYNSDEAKNLQICVEGITSDGLPVFDIISIGRDTQKRNRQP